jgi:hypothetical protein
MISRRTLATVLALIVVAGCSSSATTGPGAATTAAPGAATTAAPGTATSAAPGASVAGATPGAPAGTVAPTLHVPVMPAGGDGTCQVQISGQPNLSWEDHQDMGSILVTYWLSPAERKMAMMEATETFLINCGTEAGSLSFSLSTSTTKDQFPFGPKTYATGPGASDTPGGVTVLVSLPGGDMFKLVEAGTFDISRLDGSRMTGTFNFKIAKFEIGKRASSTPVATVSGSFDYACLSGGCK